MDLLGRNPGTTRARGSRSVSPVAALAALTSRTSGIHGEIISILLAGGTKNTQAKDIQAALELARNLPHP